MNENENTFSADERGTLIRVEQQLKDSVKNQTQIIEDLRTIFARIEKESKIISALRADTKSHLESTPVRRDEVNNRIKYLDERFTELKDNYSKFKDETRTKLENVKDDDKNVDKIIQLEKDFIEFKTEIKTSVTMTRWIFGALITALGVILSAIELFKYIKGS